MIKSAEHRICLGEVLNRPCIVCGEHVIIRGNSTDTGHFCKCGKMARHFKCKQVNKIWPELKGIEKCQE